MNKAKRGSTVNLGSIVNLASKLNLGSKIDIHNAKVNKDYRVSMSGMTSEQCEQVDKKLFTTVNAEQYLMGKKRSTISADSMGIQKSDRTRLKLIFWFVAVQCAGMFAGVGTVMYCVWKPQDGLFEMEILGRIMYLYDTNACGSPRSLKQLQDIELSNKTYGYNVLAIKHEPVSLNVLTKLSGKTRTYLKVSLAIHIVWILSAIVLRLFVMMKRMNIFKIILMVFRYVTISVCIFDVSMALVYLSDIQQSLTKAMIIRYSGWGLTPAKVENPEEFGGWVPLMAALVWMRFVVFFCLNIYLIKFVRRVMLKIKGKEVKSRISTLTNMPFPEPYYSDQVKNDHTIQFRAGGYTKF